MDRNFDDLADRFESRIHLGPKGKLRRRIISRDLTSTIQSNKPLNILDLGGGLGFFTCKFASLGHQVTYNDISVAMKDKAYQQAIDQKVAQAIQWCHGPYQNLPKLMNEPFDLILCHAVIEWLDKPFQLFPVIKQLIKPSGRLSLCFYNLAGLVFRNLVCGNFNHINKLSLQQIGNGSLTPINPCSLETIEEWLKEYNFNVEEFSGIRVFTDYTLNKRGGNESFEKVLEMELKYSKLEPYWRLGRYIHLLAKNL